MTASSTASAHNTVDSSSASTGGDSALSAARASAPPGSMQGPPGGTPLGMPMIGNHPGVMMNMENINQEFMLIPQNMLTQLRQETGVGDKEISSLSMNHKQRIVLLWRSRRGPQQAQQQAQEQEREQRNKRNSTNSGNDDIASVTRSLEDFRLGPDLFRPDTDINFERDFGQWFNPDDSIVLDTTLNPISSTSATPVPGPQQPPVPQNPNSQPSQGDPPLGGMPAPRMTDTSIANSIFSHDFINSVASSLEDFGPDLFRPDADINFERDFGQWFNPDDEMGLDMK